MSFGLTSIGYTPKTLAVIKAELEVDFRAAYGAGLVLGPDTVMGKLVDILADRLSKIWENEETVYNSQYPNSASGVSLAKVGEITSTVPNAAVKSTAVVYLAGTNTTLIPAGSLVSVQEAEDQFSLDADVTLAGTNYSIQSMTRASQTVTVNATAHGLIVNQRTFINGANETEYNGIQKADTVPNANQYTFTVVGTPATPASGSLNGDPATSGTASASLTGPVQALAKTLNQIVNSISGWTKVNNDLDAVKGTNAETDAQFRIRRKAVLQGLGAARLEAIRGSLLAVSGVTEAKVFENVTINTDGSGRPPKSIHPVVLGGVDQDIINIVGGRKAAGIESFGTTSGVFVDSQGVSHTEKFSRPAIVQIHLELDLTIDANYPTNGDTLVQTAVLAYGTALNIGDDVIVFPTLIASFASVPGITDVVVRIGTALAPTLDNNIVISETSISEFDSTRITILQI